MNVQASLINISFADCSASRQCVFLGLPAKDMQGRGVTLGRGRLSEGASLHIPLGTATCLFCLKEKTPKV